MLFFWNCSSEYVAFPKKDQGAHEAIEIVEVPNRYLAGITEVVLKDYVADKTIWRKMLTNNVEDVDLAEERDKLFAFVPEEVRPYLIENNKETTIDFHVEIYLAKVKSLNLDKTPSYSGVLKRVKGQYLIFEGDIVFNVRNWEGYVVEVNVVKFVDVN